MTYMAAKIISSVRRQVRTRAQIYKNASIIKGVVTGSVQTFRSIVPKEVARDEASKVHTMVYEGASLLIDVAEGQASRS
jgi:hypothetical protein